MPLLLFTFHLSLFTSLLTTQLPKYKTSIRVFKKQSIACRGVQTTGSFSLNEVFSTTGTPSTR